MASTVGDPGQAGRTPGGPGRLRRRLVVMGRWVLRRAGRQVVRAAGRLGLRLRGRAAPLPARVRQRFQEEAQRGRQRQIAGRSLALGAIAVLVTLLESFPATLHYYAAIAGFYALGRIQLWSERQTWWREWHPYAFAALDCALLVLVLLAPNPLADRVMPAQMELRFDNFVYLFLPMIGPLFTHQPRLILWSGLVAAAFWAVGAMLVAGLPGTITAMPEMGADWGAAGSPVLAPTHVYWGGVVQDVTVLLIVAALLAMASARTRRLVWRHAELERDRSNLARFLPPAMVDRLAAQDAALATARERPAAVMFVDIRGFTAWSEGRPPAQMIEELRGVLAQLEALVFSHGGALDKFTGDGLLATFGAFEPHGADATRALACAQEIVTRFRAWNDERIAAQRAPLEVSVGLHFGPVVIGDVGNSRRLELTVLGDSVNVASRLESLTRVIERPAAISDRVRAAVAAEDDPSGRGLIDRLAPAGEHALRGRAEPVTVWSLEP